MIPHPSKPKIVLEEGNRAVFEIENLYPGYGQTIGNGLRRVLLSSLQGVAITSVKIEGVGHEFTTIEGIMEDVVDMVLNLKQVRFRLYEEGPFTISLSATGEKKVLAKDFKTPSQVEVATPEVHIATLTSKKSKLELDAVVESGRGYIPVEARSNEKVEVGIIALDAAFSPVRHVNYEVENMRVGDRTDFNCLRIHIETDGSISPREAFEKAAHILVEQFGALADGFSESHEIKREETAKTPAISEEKKTAIEKEDELLKMRLDDLKLSSRTLNVLREGGIKTLGGLTRKKESTLRELEGMGNKGIQEIKKMLGNFGIMLRQ